MTDGVLGLVSTPQIGTFAFHFRLNHKDTFRHLSGDLSCQLDVMLSNDADYLLGHILFGLLSIDNFRLQ
jgi:hypothetical protein